VLALALGAAIFGSTYTLPQFTQGPLGFTPTLSGMLFIMRAGPISIATPILVRITGKVDPRILLGLGFLLIATGSYLQARITTAEATFWSFGAALAITGFGAALLFIPLSIAVLGATTPSEGPKASAFVNLATQLGGSIAVAGLDVLINQRESFHSAILGASASLSRPATAAFLQHGTLAQPRATDRRTSAHPLVCRCHTCHCRRVHTLRAAHLLHAQTQETVGTGRSGRLGSPRDGRK